jgi:hypothetical protein
MMHSIANIHGVELLIIDCDRNALFESSLSLWFSYRVPDASRSERLNHERLF